MALYMGKVKIAGSGSGGGGSYVLPEATSSTLGGVKVGMADTDEKLGVKLDPTTKQAYVTKAGGTGTCNYNYTQLSGTVENIVARKLTANNTVLTSDISSVVKQTIAEHGSSLMNGYDLDDEGNLTIYTKVPNLSWAFNDNHFIKSISSDTLLYTTYVDYNAWGTFANLRCLDYVNLNAIKEIGNDTFYYSVISSEVSAPNCELIRCDAFRYAYIHEINFPNCLEIEDGAFYSINNWEDEYSEYSEFAEWFFFTPITFNFPKVKKVEGVAFYVGGGALSCVIHIPNAEELGS